MTSRNSPENLPLRAAPWCSALVQPCWPLARPWRKILHTRVQAQTPAAKPKRRFLKPKPKAQLPRWSPGSRLMSSPSQGWILNWPWRASLQGNARYAAGFAAHPDMDMIRRADVAKGQKPFASIVACADSRVARSIFDQGLGDLFVTRVAGNVVDDAVLASLEYSVIHLGSTLIMVVGHERSGR